MSSEGERITSVTICNRTYHVRSGNDPEYVRELARYVDRKIVELSENTPTVDTLKVAILAALNIADDCFQARRELGDLKLGLTRRVDRLNTALARALEPDSA